MNGFRDQGLNLGEQVFNKKLRCFWFCSLQDTHPSIWA